MQHIIPNLSLYPHESSYSISFKRAFKFKTQMVYILKAEISTTLPFNLASHFCTNIENLEDNSSGPLHLIQKHTKTAGSTKWYIFSKLSLS